MKILYLTLKCKWYDMIESGEKPEEYRELKDFWGARLCAKIIVPWGGYLTKWTKLKTGDRECLNDTFIPNFEKYDAVCFARGGHFHPSIPQMTIKFNGIEIRQGRPEWGAEEGKEYFVIKLGNIISKTNVTK